MGKITTKKRILFSFRGQVTINGQIMSEKPGIFCAQNGQKLWVFGQPGGGENRKRNRPTAAIRATPAAIVNAAAPQQRSGNREKQHKKTDCHLPEKKV